MESIQFNEHISPADFEQFLLSLARPPFLQSTYMQELHTALGDSSFIVGIEQADTLIGVAFVAVIRARRGHYLYLPYGPMFGPGKWQHFSAFSNYIKKKGKEMGVDFIRSSPFIAQTPGNQMLYTQNGWKRSPIHMLAEHIWWLDITPNEEALLKGMRKTMRNLIRRAKKDGVTVRMSTDPADVEHLVTVHKDTVQQHGFVPYSDEYFRNQFAAFVKSNHVAMFLAEYKGTVISAAMIMFYGDMASYHHSGALTEFRKIPSSYLLQWEVIQEAKRRGCEVYNFWGIVPEEKMHSPILKRPHPFAGVAKFKTGFGGELLTLLPCHDMPLTPKYRLTQAIETARRIKRGFY